MATILILMVYIAKHIKCKEIIIKCNHMTYSYPLYAKIKAIKIIIFIRRLHTKCNLHIKCWRFCFTFDKYVIANNKYKKIICIFIIYRFIYIHLDTKSIKIGQCSEM